MTVGEMSSKGALAGHRAAADLRRYGRRTWIAGERWLFDDYRVQHGLALFRILFGISVVGTLVSNFAHRHYVWGGGARWQAPWSAADGYGAPFTTIFGAADSPTVFTIKYLVLIVVGVAVIVGWRTRCLLPLLVVGWTSLIRLGPMTDDAGDVAIRLLGFYACFADLTRRWSLDARRRRRKVRTARPWWPSWIGIVANNVAVMVMAGQILLIYLVSGLTKVRGSLWQDGTAIYYPMELARYVVWPALNDALTHFAPVVLVATYGSVFLQVFFPLLLLRRSTRIVALIAMTGMHLGIAVTLGLPWFSLAMIAGDMIFLRDATFAAIRRWWREATTTDEVAPTG